MDCPKCNAEMKVHSIATLQGQVEIDRCTGCGGMWFDNGEAEILKGDWMSDFLDSGDPAIGKQQNLNTDVSCPRCGKKMESVQDSDQPHITYEVCQDHGMFMDAGEFADYKNETLVETMVKFVNRAKSKLKL